MVQSPSWKANSHSPSQETLRLSWNPKVHYPVHKNQSLLHILSQVHPVHICSPYFSKNNSNIIFLSTNVRFSNQNFVYISHLSHACYINRPSHLSWLDHPNSIYLPFRSVCSPQHAGREAYHSLHLLPRLRMRIIIPSFTHTSSWGGA